MSTLTPKQLDTVRRYMAEYFGARNQATLSDLYKAVIADFIKAGSPNALAAHYRLRNFVLVGYAKGFDKLQPAPKPSDGAWADPTRESILEPKASDSGRNDSHCR
ncbi:MAG: hypothetical protein JNK21_15215 [Rhodospirillaceae bacterium]|nr:hypothetical protein [Rhodospirillaceae bacterium]